MEPGDDRTRDGVAHVGLPRLTSSLVFATKQVGKKLRRKTVDLGVTNRDGRIGLDGNDRRSAPHSNRACRQSALL
jgi:hypothetical protein